MTSASLSISPTAGRITPAKATPEGFRRCPVLCFDAEGNIGVTALQMLEAAARQVIVFEPVPELARRLRALADPRLTILELALGPRQGGRACPSPWLTTRAIR